MLGDTLPGMDFEKRLERAIERGHRAADAKAQSRAGETASEQELKRLHSRYQVELSEHIETCLRRLPDHFPGFQFASIVDDRGWGASVHRDDLHLGPGGRRDKLFSHFEMLIRPFADVHILNLVAKATIRNKEIFNRSQYEPLADADPATFRDTIDRWVLEFAERYAAT
jgi:hypothetical protein